MSAHTQHRWEVWRGQRYCKTRGCSARQFSMGRDVDNRFVWRDSMPLAQFCSRWLPAISGTQPEDLMTVKVAFPFEWNCYETWKTVYRVRFHFPNATERTERGLGTRLDVMNGWQSKYHEDFCRIDFDAEAYYRERTGRDLQIGDECYSEMRAVIQSGTGVASPTPPTLTVVSGVQSATEGETP